jgi:hypothetical protein
VLADGCTLLLTRKLCTPRLGTRASEGASGPVWGAGPVWDTFWG